MPDSNPRIPSKVQQLGLKKALCTEPAYAADRVLNATFWAQLAPTAGRAAGSSTVVRYIGNQPTKGHPSNVEAFPEG